MDDKLKNMFLRKDFWVKKKTMKKKSIALALFIMASIVGCGKASDTNAVNEQEKIASQMTTSADENAVKDDEKNVSSGEEDVREEPEDTNGNAPEEKSPFLLWEYEGYVDECAGYFWRDEFINCDYDGDGKSDRLSRKWDGNEQVAIYTIEFGNGNNLEVPKGWETGFPHVQSGDLDGDGEKEILFTLTYDTSTDPLSFGDMWLFDKDAAGKYNEVSLPLASGENGAKGLSIEYDEPDGGVIRYSIKETGLSRSEEVGDAYISRWWTTEKASEMRSVFWAELREGSNPAVRCYVAPFPRMDVSLGFDVSYRNGKYEIGYVELDSPDAPF